jgi:hypothetical protein
MNSLFTLVLIALALAVAAGSLCLYVWALVDAARNARWVWFVLMLLFGPLCIIYVLAGFFRPAQVPVNRSVSRPTER